jgi:hypothetical protein
MTLAPGQRIDWSRALEERNLPAGAGAVDGLRTSSAGLGGRITL